MLGQRRRRWTNIKTALSQRLVFAGLEEVEVSQCRLGVQLFPHRLQQFSTSIGLSSYSFEEKD